MMNKKQTKATLNKQKSYEVRPSWNLEGSVVYINLLKHINLLLRHLQVIEAKNQVALTHEAKPKTKQYLFIIRIFFL